MPLQTKDFNTLVSEQVAAIQAVAGNFEFATGSFALASVEANAGLALWVQGIALQLLAYTRATSCTGADLDSWYADFVPPFIPRLQAVAASGLVTFSRNTPTQQAVIEIGKQVQTAVGQIIFSVYEDSANPNWSPSLNAYVINPGVTSANIPVIAQVAGASGNVAAGAINQLISAIDGVDSVVNQNAFTNGADQESDQALRNRFVLFMQSFTQGTVLAAQNAVASVQSNIIYNIVERVNITGATELGFYTIIIDDGSGNPPVSLLNTITAAVNRVRPIGVNFGVYPVVPITANLTINITKNPLYHDTDIDADIRAAIANFFKTFAIGDTLIYNKLFQIIYDSNPGIEVITSLLINGATSNLPASFKERIYPGVVTISIST